MLFALCCTAGDLTCNVTGCRGFDLPAVSASSMDGRLHVPAPQSVTCGAAGSSWRPATHGRLRFPAQALPNKAAEVICSGPPACVASPFSTARLPWPACRPSSRQATAGKHSCCAERHPTDPCTASTHTPTPHSVAMLLITQTNATSAPACRHPILPCPAPQHVHGITVL